MNYFTLLARLLLIAYSIFLLLLAVGEGIAEGGYIHVVAPAIILLVVTVLWKQPLGSAVAIFIVFLGTTLYFKTYEEIGTFLIVSMPLAMATILFLVGVKVRDAI
jgi:hypothetical protein